MEALGRSRRLFAGSLAAVALAMVASVLPAALQDDDPSPVEPLDFVKLLASSERDAALTRIDRHWSPSFVPMMLEVMHLGRDRAFRQRLLDTLRRRTGQDHGWDIQDWYEWLWSREDREDYARYAEFKSLLYRNLDPRFAAYFANDRAAEIRLDEVRWGGVEQDGIPPLRQPTVVAAGDADYLRDAHVVFGVSIGGEARAYPKRILAWHEMAVDTIGGVEVAVVYCTLCGTVIVFETELAGVRHELGTSGFLYRSNKLMYDRATQSLWNTYWGRPVVGPLVGLGIELVQHPVVTTTWGAWRERHPETTVLSLDTGHRRDYSEGAAYREYFATDRLMFNVPSEDRRLRNKDEVLALTLPEHPDQPLAIAARFLGKNPVHHDRIGDVAFVVLTDESGANRVYESGGVRFERYRKMDTAIDSEGRQWRVTEDRLIGPDDEILHRLPAHRSFWFGWHAAYPRTRLVK